MYFGWAHELSDHFEVWTVQLPGRGMRITEPLMTSFQAVLDQVALAVSCLADKPFAIFGHSLGARLGFETARWLRRHGYLEPVRLFASASVAPHFPRDHPPFSQLPDSGLIQKLREFNGIPEPALANAELLELILPIVRADFAVSEDYAFSPEPPLDVPIDALYGLDDPEVRRDNAALWREHTCRAFGLHGFPGDHFYFQPSCTAVLAHISRVLRSYADPFA
jgi:medium-chain acyl-[acyl-carrier-protein] hydrolase